MAKETTKWVAADGKIFNTKSEAESHEFATEVLVNMGRRDGHGNPYVVLKYLYGRLADYGFTKE